MYKNNLISLIYSNLDDEVEDSKAYWVSDLLENVLGSQYSIHFDKIMIEEEMTKITHIELIYKVDTLDSDSCYII